MALSDHEKKLLAEMEAALEQEDPKLLSTLTGKARTRQSSRALLGLSILAVGLLVLISGLVAQATLVGVVAFLISFNPGSRGVKKPGWSTSLEERWDRRGNES
jgi:uncharacterized membrane protein YkgB